MLAKAPVARFSCGLKLTIYNTPINEAVHFIKPTEVGIRQTQDKPKAALINSERNRRSAPLKRAKFVFKTSLFEAKIASASHVPPRY